LRQATLHPSLLEKFIRKELSGMFCNICDKKLKQYDSYLKPYWWCFDCGGNSNYYYEPHLNPNTQFKQKFAPKSLPIDENALALTRLLNRFWPSSTIIDRIIKILKKIRSEKPGEKTIVFSPFLGFLDLMESHLNSAGIEFGMFTGSVTAKKRDNVLKMFAEDGGMDVLLVSSKVNILFAANSHNYSREV
jgi:SNF2 family DNA or RNA helicase